MLLSIFLPGIRTALWPRLYNSIQRSFSGDFELVIVGPNKPEHSFLQLANTKYIYDSGSPARCSQIALLSSVGEYVHIGSDDGVFLDDALNKCFRILKPGYKSVVFTKYTESDTPHPAMFTDEYWYLNFHHHQSTAKILPFENINSNVCLTFLTKRQYLLELGGFDCQFETHYAYMDAALRIQKDGASCVLAPDVVIHCDHGHDDHNPIESSFRDNDHPKLISLYGNSSVNSRVVIDLDNWKNSPSKWRRHC